MVQFHTAYIAAGGNRHPAAAAWDVDTGLLAYGSDCNVALWQPSDKHHRGLVNVFKGHNGDVTAVKFFHRPDDWPLLLISGSADNSIRLWQLDHTSHAGYKNVGVLEDHTSSINCLDVDNALLASGSADATIKIWHIHYANCAWKISLLQTIQTGPRYLPLTVTLSTWSLHHYLLAAAGTSADIYVYAGSNSDLELHATLRGHEGWIRSLALTAGIDQAGGDLLLASASQDKCIRLWRLHRISLSASIADRPLNGDHDFETLLTNKAYEIHTPSVSGSITFEALLLGHDDWIYSVLWDRSAGRVRLLSASADSSLALWDHDAGSGVWLCTTRLGDFSAQKGSTTATGSTGGFWIGLWSPDGQSVVSLGRTGSWRLWSYDEDDDRWLQGVGVSGHTKPVKDIAWAKDGSYLLSTGSDQTTRLHAEWAVGQQTSWHEFGRPQIHGYDLNCIDSVGEFHFVSGADEKLLRVFDEPRGTAELLRECGGGIYNPQERALSSAASVPVLGLSNKAMDQYGGGLPDKTSEYTEYALLQDDGSAARGIRGRRHPPIEDDLAKHTLWPEGDKLYGHGYDISTVAASNDGKIVATACKASSLDHAVVRLFETQSWRELKPSLTAHSLTVTALRFSGDGKYLLSTGRDRQWAVFERDDEDHHIFRLIAKNPKAHSRMILSASWVSSKANRVFVTAGRDKTCKIWDLEKPEDELVTTIAASAPVTAVDVFAHPVNDMLVIAVATESGDLSIQHVDQTTWTVKSSHKLLDCLCPAKSISQLLWRPCPKKRYHHPSEATADALFNQLAVSSEDSSVKILSVLFD